MMLLCFQTLKGVMSSYQSLLNYDKANGSNELIENCDETYEDLSYQPGREKFDFVPTPRKIHHSKEIEKLNKMI